MEDVEKQKQRGKQQQSANPPSQSSSSSPSLHTCMRPNSSSIPWTSSSPLLKQLHWSQQHQKPPSSTATTLDPVVFVLTSVKSQHHKLPFGSNNMQLQDDHTKKNNKWDFQLWAVTRSSPSSSPALYSCTRFVLYCYRNRFIKKTRKHRTNGEEGIPVEKKKKQKRRTKQPASLPPPASPWPVAGKSSLPCEIIH